MTWKPHAGSVRRFPIAIFRAPIISPRLEGERNGGTLLGAPGHTTRNKKLFELEAACEARELEVPERVGTPDASTVRQAFAETKPRYTGLSTAPTPSKAK